MRGSRRRRGGGGKRRDAGDASIVIHGYSRNGIRVVTAAIAVAFVDGLEIASRMTIVVAVAGHFAGREMSLYPFGGSTRGNSGRQRLRSVYFLTFGSSVFRRSFLRVVAVAAIVGGAFVHIVAAASCSSPQTAATFRRFCRTNRSRDRRAQRNGLV
eukprot:CCRYP_018417-RB/>CCRYP_018417-RB protein AED:0.45 eAED:1.00 QI:0/0/0/1/0/0/2/0/155